MDLIKEMKADGFTSGDLSVRLMNPEVYGQANNIKFCGWWSIKTSTP